MADNRLFASNHAINRPWYFLNIILLFFVAFCTNWFVNDYFIPNTTSETYIIVGRFIEWFAYLIYIITFLSLLDRRLYDISGDRRKDSYKNISSVLIFCIFAQIVSFVSANTEFKLPLSVDILQQISYSFTILFLIITIVLGLFKGKITERSYDEYEKDKKRQDI